MDGRLLPGAVQVSHDAFGVQPAANGLRSVSPRAYSGETAAAVAGGEIKHEVNTPNYLLGR